VEIKSPMRYHLTYVRMAIVKKLKDKWWQGCGENGTRTQQVKGE
jgi:hypothetical protein